MLPPIFSNWNTSFKLLQEYYVTAEQTNTPVLKRELNYVMLFMNRGTPHTPSSLQQTVT